MAENCSRCAALEAENQALKAENEALRRENALLRRKLAIIAEYARRVVAQAERTMLEHQPRGRWAFVRGAKDVAQRVRQLL